MFAVLVLWVYLTLLNSLLATLASYVQGVLRFLVSRPFLYVSLVLKQKGLRHRCLVFKHRLLLAVEESFVWASRLEALGVLHFLT